MAVKVIVFDFDGTLVDSNRLKQDAYFEIFPQTASWRGVVQEVVAQRPGESRYVVIPDILKRMGERDEAVLARRGDELAEAYNRIVETGAKRCPEIRNAGRALEALKRRYRLYLSSNTPDPPLADIVAFRGWEGHFAAVYGYPRRKSRTLLGIMEREGAAPRETVVVGDGESDRRSAAETGCFFVPVTEGFDLLTLSGVVAGLGGREGSGGIEHGREAE